MPSLPDNQLRVIFPAILALIVGASVVAVHRWEMLGVIGLVGVAGLLVACFTHPLVPFSIYFGALFFADTKLPGLPVTVNQIIAPVFLLSAFVYYMRGRALPVKFGLLPLLGITALYFALSGVLGQHLENGLIYARYVIIYLVLAVGVAISLSKERTILALAWIIVLLTSVAAAGGFFEAAEKGILGDFVGSWGYKHRVSGTAPNPIVFAWNMLYAFPFAFLLYSESRSRYTRLVAIALGLLIIGAAMLTFNRQSYLLMGVVILLCAILYTYRNRAVLLGLLSVLFTFSAFTILPVIVRRLLTVADLSKDYSYLERRDSFLIGIEMFKDSPIFGVGFGAFPKVWQQYIPPDYSTYFAQYRGGTVDKFMDMGMMAVLVETGLLGLLLFLSILGTILVRTWKYRRAAIKSGDAFAQNLSSTVIVVVVFFAATSLIQDTFLYARVWIFYGVAMLIDRRQLPLREAVHKADNPESPDDGILPEPA